MIQRQWTVPASATDTPLLDFLAEALSISRRRAKGLLDARAVFVNDQRVWMARHRLRAGDRIQVNLPGAPVPDADIPLLYQDHRLVVANKPAGRLSNGPDSVETDLQRTLSCPQLAAVHRLDRDTTGCLIYARGPDTLEGLIAGFRDQAVTKVYRAIVYGTPSPREGRFNRPIDGKRARTEYRVLSAGPLAAQVRVRIATGRTHQIRKHFATAGHPVAGDPVYATKAIRDPELKRLPRQMLHAESLQFLHPESGEPIDVNAPLPADFSDALKRLGC